MNINVFFNINELFINNFILNYSLFSWIDTITYKQHIPYPLPLGLYYLGN